MATSAVSELLRANAHTLEAAVRRAEEADPAAELISEVEDIVADALHNVALARRYWERTKGLLQEGAPAYVARPVVASAVETGRSHEESLRRLLSLALEGKKLGVELTRTDALSQAIAEVKARLAETTELLELIDRPRASIDPEQLRLAREAFKRGEFRDVREVLAERLARGKS